MKRCLPAVGNWYPWAKLLVCLLRHIEDAEVREDAAILVAQSHAGRISSSSRHAP